VILTSATNSAAVWITGYIIPKLKKKVKTIDLKTQTNMQITGNLMKLGTCKIGLIALLGPGAVRKE
jgi:hypothetical protein